MASDATSTEVASSTAKRASSRVRKQPEHFTSSPFASSKRKRHDNGDDDAEEDEDMMEDDPSDEGTDAEDDEPAAEEIREKAKKARKPKSSAPRKPAQKKAKVNGVTLPIRGAANGPPRKRAPKKLKNANIEDAEAAGGLYAEIFAKGKAIEEAVSDWLKAFEDHEASALTDVINFVLKAAGCNSKVTEHDIEDPDGATARLTDLQEEHQATEPTDYPIIAKGKSASAFKAKITSFMHTLIKAIGANGTLCENPDLIDNIHCWLSTMTSATNRSFRHTSTVCSLALLSALCEVAKEYATKSSDNQRLAEVERRKPKANKERVKQIEQKAKAASEDLRIVNDFLKDWFDTVFIHRYRDVDAAIRRDCVEALGNWIMTLPDKYLDGNHLRYMGWLLSDESALTRLETLKQLRRLYTDSDKIGGLKTFTEKFRPRMIEIGTSDADIGVRVAGLELIALLRDNDLLEPDDLDTVGRLVFHEDIKVRKAVANFFSAIVDELCVSRIDELGGVESLEEVLPEVGDDNFEVPRIEWLKMKSLAEMLHAYDQEDAPPSLAERNKADGTLLLNATGVESRFTLAIDVLYDKIVELKEWQALAGYLLFDHSSGRSNGVSTDTLSQFKHEAVLTENEEIILLEVLNASVKRTMSDLAEKITGTKGKSTKKQKEEMQEEQEEAVRHLTDLIPRLLKKFGDIPSTAGAVLRLGGVLALPSLQGLRHDSAASAALLDDLRKQFMSHGADEVLAPATAAILHAQSYGELDEPAFESVTNLWEDVVSNLAELLNVKTVTLRGVSSHEELLALSNNLLRIVRLATVSNCIQALEDESITQTDESSGKEYKAAIDYIVELVHRGVHSEYGTPEPDEAALEDLIATRAAEAALFYFRWKLAMIMVAIKEKANDDLAYSVMEALAVRRDTLQDNLTAILDSRKAGEQVCVSAASCMLDLYTSSAILGTETAQPGVDDVYTALILDFQPEHEKAIMKVFNSVERDFARATGKKLEDPKSDEPEVDIDADPVDDDPISDDEDEEEMDTQASQALRQRRDAQMMKPVLLEERLCQLTTKLVWAIIARVIDGKAARKRLERNKTQLGANFKEVLAYLDDSTLQKKKGGKDKAAKPKSKATVNGAAKKKLNPKSNAIVAEDEEEDEIEDFDADEEQALEAEDEQPREEDEEMVNGADEVSVAGD